MKDELRHRLYRNLSELKNTNLIDGTDEFMKDGDITQADAERARSEVTTEEKNRKLVNILMTKADDVFDKLLNWLTKEGHKDLVKALAEGGEEAYDLTEINLRDQTRTNIVLAVLKDRFKIEDDATVKLGIVVEEVVEQIRFAGEYMTKDHTEKLIKAVLKEERFRKVDVIKNKNKNRKGRYHEILKNLKLKQTDDTETAQAELEDWNYGSGETENIAVEEHGTDGTSLFTTMTVETLIEWLEPVLKENKITSNIAMIFRKQDVDGKAFENMTNKELEELVPDLKWGNRKNILVDRDKHMKKSKSEDNANAKLKVYKQRKPVSLPKQDCLRPFGVTRKLDDKYIFGAQVADLKTRTTDRMSPVHKYVMLSPKENSGMLRRLVTEMVNYASACMNERTNATIHFGIAKNKIAGITIDTDACSTAFTDGITKRFFPEQIETAMRCIRPPQFIPVIRSKFHNAFVVEVDIIPSSELIGNEAIFLRSSDTSDDARLFRLNEHGDAVEVKGLELHRFMEEKVGLTNQREKAEKRISRQSGSEPNLRVQLQEFLCSGEESLDADIYPLIFASPPDEEMNKDYLLKNFEFIKSLDARAIFDFDHKGGSDTLASTLAEQDEIYMTKVVDDFDDERNETKKKEIKATLEDIKKSSHKTWIYCNGFEQGNKASLNRKDWIRERTKGFREITTFYKEEIPHSRARIIVLLMSKEFEVISEAVREIEHLFQNQWIVLAANEGIATAWKDAMLKLYSAYVDRQTLDSKCLVGLSWELLNETVLQFTGVPKSKTTEIPTAKGAFHKIPKRIQNDLCDIDILSCNECENETVDGAEDGKHKQAVEEDFYRGVQVTWWNFFYQGQVLVRKDHRVFMTGVQDALRGQTAYGEKIAKATIYHQPGSGGTTSARQALWDLRRQYPCCIVKTVTDQTADQIQRLRTLADDDHPKPPVILLDNEDDEILEKLTDELLKKAKTQDCSVFCLLLLCCRQIQLPFEKCPIRLTLKHELANEDIRWFEDKNRQLHDSFEDKTGINPKLLIAFNIMKSNFNKDAIQRSVKEFVDAVVEREREFLFYLSFINAYDIDYQPLPIACFDPIMCKMSRRQILGKGWEQRLEQPIRVLLNRSQRHGIMGGSVVSFRIISPLLSKEILKYLMELHEMDLTQTACNFFESGLFFSKNAVNNILFKIAASLLKKRRWIVKMEDGEEKPFHQTFSPLLQEIFDDKNESGAIKVVELGFNVIRDPMIAQQVARLHNELGDIERAEYFIKQAIQISPNSSYLYHTYGTICRNELISIQRSMEQKKIRSIPTADTLRAVELSKKAIEKYKHVEDITKRATRSTGNPFGLIGILETVIYLLDTLAVSECFPNPEDLHKFLVQKNYIGNASPLGENVNFLKDLHSFVDEIIGTLEADLSTLTYEKRTERKTVMSFVSTGSLEKLKINLNNYFGENIDEAPESFSDMEKAVFRRGRAKTLGCDSLVGILKQKKKSIKSILGALKQVKANIDSGNAIAFDFLVALSCTLKVECNTPDKNVSEIGFDTCQLWSKNLYEKIGLSKQISVEASLFIILLNWPQFTDQLVNHSILRKAMDTLLAVSETRTDKRVQMPIFYIGQGDAYKRIVLPYSLKLYGNAKSKNSLRSRQALDSLRRFEGMLLPGGNKVSVNFQISSNPGTPTITIPLATRVANSTMWNKKVYFVVGLGMSGIFAYDATTETIDTLKAHAFEMPTRRQTSAREQNIQPPHEVSDIYIYHDKMQQLLQHWWYLHEQIRTCHHTQQRIQLENQLSRLESERYYLVKLRIAQVEASRNFC